MKKLLTALLIIAATSSTGIAGSSIRQWGGRPVPHPCGHCHDDSSNDANAHYFVAGVVGGLIIGLIVYSIIDDAGEPTPDLNQTVYSTGDAGYDAYLRSRGY